jgi:hypothetical protein
MVGTKTKAEAAGAKAATAPVGEEVAEKEGGNSDAGAKVKPAKAKPAKAKPAKARPAKAKLTKAKPAEAEPAKAEPAKAEPAEAEPAEAKPEAATKEEGDDGAPLALSDKAPGQTAGHAGTGETKGDQFAHQENGRRYLLELAKTGRAVCKGRCKGAIPKGQLRFGSSDLAIMHGSASAAASHLPLCRPIAL